MTEFAAARAILDGLFDPCALLDAAGRPAAMNDAFVQLLSAPRRRVQKRIDDGATAFDLLGAPTLRARCEEARMGGAPVRLAEVPLVCGDQALTGWIALVPVVDGDARAVLLVLRDVTAEARMQSHFRQLLAESQARADDLDKKVKERTAELQEVLEEVTRLSRTDPLTGALNRRAFTEIASHTLQLAERHQRVVGFLMCDLDFFKKLNDGFGHQAGDIVLVATSKALLASVRGTDRVARFGGEEFVVMLTETTREAVLAVGERVCASIRALPCAELVPGKDTPQTVSVGIAIAPDHGHDLEELLRRADEALYEAKHGGRDRVAVAAPVAPKA